MKRFQNQPPVPETAVYLCLLFACSMLVMGFCMSTQEDVFVGWGRIFTSRAVLFSDYFVIGGIGASMLNAGVVMLMSMGLVYFTGAPFSGNVVAALFLMPGFALFGKNPLNVLPFWLGVALYCRFMKVPMKKHAGAALYSTTLCPVVSEILLMPPLPLAMRVPLAFAAGALIGFIIVPLATHMLSVHRGYVLFNYGYASGFLAYLMLALTRACGATVQSASDWMPGRPIAVFFYLVAVCAVLVSFGLWLAGWKHERLRAVFAVNGCAPNNDMLHSAGIGSTMVNMGVIGFLCLAFNRISGGDLSGPVVGAIFTAMGFGASGVQPRNFLPVLLGIWLFSFFGAYPANAHNVQIAAIFGAVALAPVAGEYGILAGLAAGLLHYALVSVTGSNTGGLNLYNNGFAAGIVASVLVTLFDTFRPEGGMRAAFLRAQRRVNARMKKNEEASEYDEF